MIKVANLPFGNIHFGNKCTEELKRLRLERDILIDKYELEVSCLNKQIAMLKYAGSVERTVDANSANVNWLSGDYQ